MDIDEQQQQVCCDGSFQHIGSGPFLGLVPLGIAFLAIVPVVRCLVRLIQSQRRASKRVTSTAFKCLLLSGTLKIINRIYAGAYAASAAGSAYVCSGGEDIRGVCLNNAYGYEAFVLGYVGLFGGILDWMTIGVAREYSSEGWSLSDLRWRIIAGRGGCGSCSANCVVGASCVLIGVVGAVGHLLTLPSSGLSARLKIVVGIFVAVVGMVAVCLLGPIICCCGQRGLVPRPISMRGVVVPDIGGHVIRDPEGGVEPVPGGDLLPDLEHAATSDSEGQDVEVPDAVRATDDVGYVRSDAERAWKVVNFFLLDIPGLLIGFGGGNTSTVLGWGLDFMDHVFDTASEKVFVYFISSRADTPK